MKITVVQKNFQKALAVTERIISKNISLPILHNILLRTDNNKLIISSTNLEIGINYSIGAKVEEKGEIAIPARILSDFISNIQDEKITLTIKGKALHINSNNYKTQIIGFDTKEFPIIPKIKEKPIITLPAQILKTSFLSVINSASLLETRPELAGVFIKFTANNIELAATDSFRLTERIINQKPNNTGSAIIPRNTILEIIRVLSDIDTDVNITLSDNQILFSSIDFTIISRLIDGNYPDYKKVIPENFVSKVLVLKEELEKGVRLASLFTSNISDIKIKVSENKTEITAKNIDKGELHSSIESKLKNNPFIISLNYNYLLDGIKAIRSDKVVLQYTGDGSPLVVKKGDEDKSFTYVIMPLRE